MPLHSYLAEVINHVQSSPSFGKTVKGIAKQALYSSGGTITGGIILGPIGALAGGIVASVAGYAASEPYPSCYELVKNLSAEQQKDLVQAIVAAVGGLSFAEFLSWYQNPSSPAALQAIFVSALALAEAPMQ